MAWLAKFVLAMGILAGAGGTSLAQVQVFVAASLIDVMGEAGHAFEAQTGIGVRFIHAGSSTLAQQIVGGAPADIFISANADWMRFVQEGAGFGAGLPLFGNSLVVIGRVGSEISLNSFSQLNDVLGSQRLALGDPAHVPAGIYARQALQNAGIWGAVENRLAPAANVRDALLLVAAGAAPLGIVYASDVRDPRVRTLYEIDDSLHEKIVYWGAVRPNAGADVAAFFSFLQSEDMDEIALGYGFSANERK
ncbi:MAG TPA: molybdate ABC transporter substrate-binding protein [Devosia sp.]|nr:molybdate ABC transporter substrate-binding protein [Devosia sp.]